MSAIKSTAVMVERLSGMLGTEDLKPNEKAFVEKLVRMKDANELTSLSEKQLEWLDDLHRRHFA